MDEKKTTDLLLKTSAYSQMKIVISARLFRMLCENLCANLVGKFHPVNRARLF